MRRASFGFDASRTLLFPVLASLLFAVACGDDTTVDPTGAGASGGGGAGASGGGGGAGASGGGGTGGAGGGGAGGEGGGGGAGGEGGGNAGPFFLDPTFGNAGVVTTGFGENADYLNGAARQADGKVVLVGTTALATSSEDLPNSGEILLARLDPDGALDPTFGQGGKVLTPLFGRVEGRAVAVQPDQKILAAGYAEIVPSSPVLIVARYNPDGSLDASFGGGAGFVAPLDGIASAIALQDDGKIIAAGQNKTLIPGEDVIMLVRLLDDGSLDAGFGAGGFTTAVFGTPSAARDVALQPDGRIMVVGNNPDAPDGGIQLARFATDGALDPTFDGDGMLATSGDYWEYAQALALQPDGRILVGGSSTLSQITTQAIVLRFMPGGALDPSFGGGDGQAELSVPNAYSGFTSLALQPDGALLAGGLLSADNPVAVRLLSDGALDPAFGAGGVVNGVLPVDYSDVSRVLLQPDGTLLVAGTRTRFIEGKRDMVVARVSAGGAVDATFGAGGIVSFNSGASIDVGLRLALQPGGKVLVAGMAPASLYAQLPVLARYDVSGALDATFGDAGTAKHTDPMMTLRDLAPASDDGILLAGSYFEVARYDASGALDTMFGSSGVASVSFGAFTQDSRALAVAPSGKIVVVGHADYELAVARLLPVGSMDSTFNGDGMVITDVTPQVDIATAVVVAPDEKIVVAGSAGEDVAVVRYQANGNLDATLGAAGVTIITPGFEVNELALQPDGKILVGGHRFMDPNSTTLVLARLGDDGALDLSFGDMGVLTEPLGELHGSASTRFRGMGLAALSNGAILVSTSIVVGGREQMLALRYLQNGSPNEVFSPGGKLIVAGAEGAWSSYDLLVQPDGDIVLGGRGFSKEGGSDLGLARLSP